MLTKIHYSLLSFMKTILQYLLPFFSIVLASVVFFYPLFLPQLQFFSSADFGESDIWMFNIPLRYELSQSLKENSLPLWNNDIGNGFPIFAETQIAALSPVNIVLFKFFPFSLAFNLVYPLTYIFCGIGTYLFGKKIGFTNAISLYIAIIFSFSGFFVAHNTHTNLVQTAAFLPWFFWCTYNLVYNHRAQDLIAFVFILCASILSGFAQITFISLLGSCLFFVFCLYDFRKSKRLKKIKHSVTKTTILFMLAIMLGFLAASIQIVPTVEFLSLSERASGFSLENANYFSFPPIHFLGFIDPFTFGNPRMGTYKTFTDFDGSIFWENSGYLGIVPLLLGLSSLFFIKKNRPIVFFWILLSISAFLMLGKHTPVKYIHTLPIFNLFHVPSRFLLLFVWAFVILSGYTLLAGDKLLRKKMSAFVSTIFVFLITLLSFINIFFVWQNYHALVPADKILKMPETANIISQTPTHARVMSIGEEIPWNEHFLSHGWEDITPFLYLRNSLRQNSNLLYGIPQYFVYAGSGIQQARQLQYVATAGINRASDGTLIVSSQSARLLSLSGLSHLITTTQLTSQHFALQKTVSPPNTNTLPNFYIYQQIPLASAFVVRKKIVTSSPEQTMLDSKFDPTTSVVLQKDDKKMLAENDSSQANVSITKRSHTTTSITITKNESPGYLVMSDTYYPGWNVYVDGKQMELLVANIAQRAVYIPAGNHIVTINYQPLSFLIGSILSGITLLCLLVGLQISRRK